MFAQFKNLTASTWVILALVTLIVAMVAYNVGIGTGAKIVKKAE